MFWFSLYTNRIYHLLMIENSDSAVRRVLKIGKMKTSSCLGKTYGIRAGSKLRSNRSTSGWLSSFESQPLFPAYVRACGWDKQYYDLLFLHSTNRFQLDRMMDEIGLPVYYAKHIGMGLVHSSTTTSVEQIALTNKRVIEDFWRGFPLPVPSFSSGEKFWSNNRSLRLWK